MITAERIDEILTATSTATARFDRYITSEIANRVISLYDNIGAVEAIPATRRDMIKLIEHGWDINSIANAVEKFEPELKGQLKQAFMNAAYDIAVEMSGITNAILIADGLDQLAGTVPTPKKAENIYIRSGISTKAIELGLTPAEVRLLDRAYRKTSATMDNLTGTTAYTAQQQYYNACNDAYWQVTHGVSLERAVRGAVDALSNTGSKIMYPSGHQDNIEVAVLRSARTGMAQAAGDITLSRVAEMGHRYVLVSAHIGARVTEQDEPANHYSWQGKVYQLSDETLKDYLPTDDEQAQMNNSQWSFMQDLPVIVKGIYPDFETVTGYGTGEGLLGWNCRHSFDPFIPGININNTKQYSYKENKKAYDLSQEQRAKERYIRKLKRKQYAYERASQVPNNANAAKYAMQADAMALRVHEKYEEYRTFCDDNHLKTAMDRTYVSEH